MTGFPRPPVELTALVDPRLHGAACAGRAPLFDPPLPGESSVDTGARHSIAKRICRSCPVLAACRQALLDLPENQHLGIWAGMDAEKITNRFGKEAA